MYKYFSENKDKILVMIPVAAIYSESIQDPGLYIWRPVRDPDKN